MKAPIPGFAGAVLCGGASRRMGSAKALIELDGVSLLERALGTLRAAGATPLLVASRSGELGSPGCVPVSDPAGGAGPLAGLVGVLRAMGTAPLCAVVAVDMPDLSPELLQLLAQLWAGEDALVPVSDRGPEPLHALYAASALPQAELRLRSDDVSLRGLLGSLRVRFLAVEDHLGPAIAATFAANLNRPEEVAAWRRRRRGEEPRPPS